ncbi:MAG: type II secretion system F family protein [Rhodocyclaceae bacterium]|nr:type II secretion system F family protein [Rhodocyclaceae bacterium]
MEQFSTNQLAFLAIVFLVVSGVPLLLFLFLRRSAAQQRLEQLVAAPGIQRDAAGAANGWVETVARAASPLAKLSLPDDGWEESELRLRFIQAGLRNPGAPVIFFAIKTVAAFGLPALMWLVRVVSGSDMPLNKFMILVALISGIGFFLPNVILNRLRSSRQRELFESFPDALDLLTICVEAGLSLEAALNRVAREISLKSRQLAEELQLVCLEFRAGAGKERALRNLSMRTGVEDIDTLVAMLVQSEKFGTSIGESLRIHSEMLRVKRQQRAEESAAKVAVKLIFPLVLCIFPAIMIVVAGPALIRIVKILPTLLGSGGG